MSDGKQRNITEALSRWASHNAAIIPHDKVFFDLGQIENPGWYLRCSLHGLSPQTESDSMHSTVWDDGNSWVCEYRNNSQLSLVGGYPNLIDLIARFLQWCNVDDTGVALNSDPDDPLVALQSWFRTHLPDDLDDYHFFSEGLHLSLNRQKWQCRLGFIEFEFAPAVIHLIANQKPIDTVSPFWRDDEYLYGECNPSDIGPMVTELIRILEACRQH